MADNKKPSADQTSTGPDQGHIVHEYTLNDPGPGEKKIVLNIPPECEHMTAAEFLEYSKEHPEAWESFAGSLQKAIEPAINAAVQAAAGVERVKETIQRTTAVFYDVSNIVKTITKALLNLPEWADPESIEKIYAELEELEPFLDAEIAKRPQYEGKTFFDLFELLEFKDALYFIAPADVLKESPPEIDPDRLVFINDLLEVREAARARAVKEAAIKEKARESIDPLSLKSKNWLPLFHGALTDDLMRASTRDFIKPTESAISAYYTAPNGQKYNVDDLDKIIGMLSTSAKKILDTAVLYLANENIYGTGRNSIKPQVKIPLLDYLEKNGYSVTPQPTTSEEERAKEAERIKDRIKKQKSIIRRDLNDLRQIKWTGEEKRGRNAGDYADLQIISGHKIVKGFIYVNFDIDAARYLANGSVMWYPTCLLKHDNKKSNPYPIGRKIALHNSIDRNFFAGTDCTLSVMALLNAAPEIPTITEIEKRGQRNWKDKIKKPLETALNENKDVGLISKWEYRHPKTGQTYTAEEASALPWEVYSTLMIDWIMAVKAPGQEERRAKIKAEIEAAEAAGKITQKKRGRPRKKPQNKKRGPSEEQKGTK